MIWMVWRRRRAAFYLAAALLVATAIVLVIGRVLLVGKAADLNLAACVTTTHATCPSGPGYELYETFGGFYVAIRAWLLVVFPLIGVIVGVGLFASEFEQRTYVLALTQATGRIRWWATGVLTTIIPAVIGVIPVAVLADWALQPFSVLYPRTPMDPPDFDVSGLMPASNTLLAAALAVTVGLLIRSTLAAAVATVLAWTLIFFLALFNRYDILPDQVTTIPIVRFDGPAVDTGARVTGSGYLDAAGNAVNIFKVTESVCGEREEYPLCLRDAGVVAAYKTYQPNSYFWPLQVIVAGINAALSIMLLGISALRLRVTVSTSSPASNAAPARTDATR